MKDQKNFPYTQRFLTVAQVGLDSQKIWSMLGEDNSATESSTPLVLRENEMVKLQKVLLWEGPCFYAHFPVKLTFPKNIDKLSQDGSIKNEMGQGSME